MDYLIVFERLYINGSKYHKIDLCEQIDHEHNEIRNINKKNLKENRNNNYIRIDTKSNNLSKRIKNVGYDKENKRLNELEGIHILTELLTKDDETILKKVLELMNKLIKGKKEELDRNILKKYK